MQKKICVFCSSSDDIDAYFFDVARDFGKRIAENNCALVCGGANTGLMSVLADSVRGNGGTVIEVMPQLMQNQADVFVGLPGGFGTLDEIFEFLPLKQLNTHSKPIIFLNTQGFYDQLIHLFETFCREKFVSSEYQQLYHLASDVRSIFSYLKTQYASGH